MPRAIPTSVRRSLCLAALALPFTAGAQIFEVRRPSGEPAIYGSLGVGLFQSQSVIDGTTQSEWRLNDAVQYRGSLEYALRRGSSLGVVATHARVPFRYIVPCGNLPVGTPCGGFDGDMTVQSVWGTFHGGGGGEGLSGVLDAGLGYTWYRDFAVEDNSSADVDSDRDFSFFLGTGFGYGITRRLSINLVQDFVFVRHQGEGLTNDDRTTTQQRVTRLVVRYGLGNRRLGI